MKKLTRVLPILLALILLVSGIPMTAQAASKSYIAEPTTFKFTMDGIGIVVRNYEVNYKSTLYVKVRDIASVLNETEKNFSVVFNSKKNTLTLTPGKMYIDLGSENEKRTSKAVSDRAYDKGTKLYLGSKKQSTKVYTINKEQYVSLTALAKLIDFSVTKVKSTYKIDTTIGYSKPDSDVTTPTPAPSEGTIKSESITKPVDAPVYGKIDGSGILKDPFPEAAYIKNPKTPEDFEKLLKYMFTRNIKTFVIETDFDSYHDELKSDIGIASHNLFYCVEYNLGAIDGVDYDMDWNEENNAFYLTLTFGHSGSIEVDSLDELAAMNKEYLCKAKEAVQGMIDSGVITASMSETEKARAIAMWICNNVVYDDTLTHNTGYTALVDHTTVCQGYTALYQLMCRYVGLYKVLALSCDDFNHSWTAQVLDGKTVMTDVTWMDSGEYDKWFATTPQFMRDQGRYWSTEEGDEETETTFFYPDWLEEYTISK
jgi:hypothetical protein